jgi:hypothetical protein
MPTASQSFTGSDVLENLVGTLWRRRPAGDFPVPRESKTAGGTPAPQKPKTGETGSHVARAAVRENMVVSEMERFTDRGPRSGQAGKSLR